MTRSDLVKKVSEDTGLMKVDAKKALDSVIENIREAIVSGEGIQIKGFGHFVTKKKNSSYGNNLHTGEKHVFIPEKAYPVFIASPDLKAAVKESGIYTVLKGVDLNAK